MLWCAGGMYELTLSARRTITKKETGAYMAELRQVFSIKNTISSSGPADRRRLGLCAIEERLHGLTGNLIP